jgi:hypothetical protein
MMAALVVVALFWGNCFSCPQVILAFRTHHDGHGCCHKTKTAAPGCESQSLQNFVKSDPGVHAPVFELAGIVSMAPPMLFPAREAVEFPQQGPAPPDLLSLHSSFRI